MLWHIISYYAITYPNLQFYHRDTAKCDATTAVAGGAFPAGVAPVGAQHVG